MELTQEKSQEQSDIITAILPLIQLLDTDYCYALVKEMRDKASWQDSASVLSLSYSPTKTNVLRKQAEALKHLTDYVACLKEVDELKSNARKEDAGRQALANLFL